MSGTAALSWFGKLRSRGDFVCSTRQGALTRLLDQWLSRALADLAQDPRWKQLYDNALCAHFAVLGVRSRVALAGHLRPSADAAGRRFPFVATASFEIGAPMAFIAQAPLVLGPAWLQLQDLAARACADDDAASVLAGARQVRLDIAPQADAWAREDGDFVSRQTLGELQALLEHSHPGVDLRRVLLALGLLLQPVPDSGLSRLDTGLRLPLPGRPHQAAAMAALWLRLIARFLARGDFELMLLLPCAGAPAEPTLLVGFAGASPAMLQALFTPASAKDAFITLHAPCWVDGHVVQDAALRRLDAHLRQPTLPLREAADLFSTAFLKE
ncbi:type VI secretion system-associated protein TagF [Azohydromonas lata]|uniref:Type VI secretion system-associated protein TagF n=1 Tax=Azohydromonas lata TaxID=45677 RepID=A0ABU5IM62_9BURK|nr:type VI secretion system-associated protein TagF [Azohydromonas lata]MDZ5459990.1 type VI secretion system-associated protein TagF [Azohydromonas lata]